MDNGFSGRLKELIGPDSVRSFSRLTGIGSTTLQKYLDGAVPGLDKAARIAAARGVSLEWLATGEGQPRSTMSQSMVSASPAEGFVPIPQLDVRASAGAGHLAVSDEAYPTADVVAFREAWLRRLGVSANFARILICQGDSMHETISDGDMMLLDTSIREVQSDGVYVLVFNGLVKVKRVEIQRDRMLLKSDNPHYETEIVPASEAADLHIAGRVKWAGGEI
ncbi:MAG: S24 family peptidase [Pseudomonadota bacterium]